MLHLSSLFRFAEVLKELFQAGANVLDNDGTASHDVQVVVKRGEKDGEGGRIWSFFFVDLSLCLGRWLLWLMICCLDFGTNQFILIC